MNSVDSRSARNSPSAVHKLLRLVLLFGLIYLGLIAMFAGLQRKFIYAARRGPVPVSLSELPPNRIQEVLVPGADGITLHGWLTKPLASSTRDGNTWLVILFPGNAGHRAFRTAILDDFNHLGCAALICDYRGYAENAGKPSEEAFARDALAIWDYARNELGYPAEHIILCGESLGGGVATRLAWDLSKRGIVPGGLILRTTFTSLTDAAKALYPWLPIHTFLADRYPSLDRLPSLQCPVLVIHGEQDRIVPFQQGQQLFAAAPATSASGVPKSFLGLPDVGHNDVMSSETSRRAIYQAHRRFLDQIRSHPAVPAAATP